MCPWDRFTPANLAFCERALCGWVVEPSNTWSNLGFVVAGVLILWHARRAGVARAALLGWIAIATGIGSAAFHGTRTFVGQVLDLGSMYLESGFFVAVCVQRWFGWNTRRTAALFVALYALALGGILTFQTAGIWIFAGEITVFVLLELRLKLRGDRVDYRWLLVAVGTFAVSYAIWWLDKLGIVCDPDNHVFTGHAAWHLLGALGCWCWYRYFAQFG